MLMMFFGMPLSIEATLKAQAKKIIMNKILIKLLLIPSRTI